MNMRKFAVMFLMLSLLIVTVGCSKNDNKPESGATESAVNGMEDYGIADLVEDFSEERNPEDALRVGVGLISGSDFSDNVAWVRFGDDIVNCFGILRSDGEIIANEFTEGIEIGDYCSTFSQGYSYVNHRDISDNTKNSFAIVNVDGEVTASSPDDGTGYQILAGGDGVYFVRQQILSMTENEERYGFIDAHGQWLVAPTLDNPLRYGYNSEEAKHGGELHYYYLGENVFAALVDDYFDCFAIYNLHTGMSKSYDNRDYEAHLGDRSEIVLTNYGSDEPFMFSNGLCMVIWRDAICAMNTSGEIQELIAMPRGYDSSRVVYANGVFLYGSVDFNETWEMHDGAFYDLAGNKILDMSQYNLAVYVGRNGFYEFHNGTAAVEIVGEDGKSYITHIDTQGNMRYEPIAISTAANAIGHSGTNDGTMYIRLMGDRENSYVLRPDGQISMIHNSITIWNGSESSESRFHFSGGYAWCEENSVYISDNGEILYTYLVG